MHRSVFDAVSTAPFPFVCRGKPGTECHCRHRLGSADHRGELANWRNPKPPRISTPYSSRPCSHWYPNRPCPVRQNGQRFAFRRALESARQNRSERLLFLFCGVVTPQHHEAVRLSSDPHKLLEVIYLLLWTKSSRFDSPRSQEKNAPLPVSPFSTGCFFPHSNSRESLPPGNVLAHLDLETAASPHARKKDTQR